MGARHDDDAELVLAARGGDQQAFSALFERWFDRSYDVAWRIVRNPDTAAEVAQDTFLAAWQGLDGLRDPSAFGGWVLRTARNRALNRLEKEGRSRAVDPGDAVDALDAAPVGVVASSEGRPGGDPADAVADAQQVALVWEAAEALGERDLSILDLHLRHGLEPAEIAEALDVTPNNAHQLLFRLRKKLGGAVRARVLWRGGDPRCDELARALFGAGVTAFDATAVKVVEAHADACPICSQARSLATSPEALFAAAPLLAAPPGVRAAVVEALRGAGVPLDPSAAASAPPTGVEGGASSAGPGNDAGTAVGAEATPGTDVGHEVGQATGAPGGDAGAAVGGGAGGPAGTDPTLAMAAVAGTPPPVLPTSPIGGPPSDQDGSGGRARRAGLVAGLLLVALLVGAGIGWLLLDDGDDTEAVAAAGGPGELEAVGSTTSTTDAPTTTAAPPSTATTAPSTTTSTTSPTTTPTTQAPQPSTTTTSTTAPPAPPPPAPPGPPTVDSFTATYLDLGGGGCQSFQGGYELRWTTTGATSTSLSGPGAPGTAGAPDGTTVLCLGPPAPSPSTVSWTLTATGPGGSVQRSAAP